MKTLNIIESAYRATIEEQDDTIVWITHALKGAGADVDVLLQGNAVCYAARDQDASGLCFGAKQQTKPPRLADDIVKLVDKGVTVHVVADDLEERGLKRSDLIDGLEPVSRSRLATLLDGYPRVWKW